tara:strand:+ start:2286 stop:2906 length:621 start_codon:yes stop_codon:yes gene_type:complete
MAEVSVDGEEVVFEGEAPQEAGQVFDLLLGAMSERGRALVSFMVDGKDLMFLAENDPPPSSFQKIEAFTLTHVELTLRLLERVEKETESLEEELLAYSRKVLFLGWSEIFNRMDEFVGKIQPIADLVDNLEPFSKTYDPPWRGSFEVLQSQQSEALERVLTCFKAGDSAGLSDAIASSFLPMLAEFRQLSRKKMQPQLREEMELAG